MSARPELSRPADTDAARGRAQSGFTTASAITSLLVAAGLFSGVADRSHWARYLGVVVLAVWLVTMFLFLRAAGTSHEGDDELRRVERTAAHARWSGAVAMVVTIVVFVLITSTGLAVDHDQGVLRLNADGGNAMVPLCSALKGRLLPGSLEVPSLKSDYIVFTVDKGWCFKDASVTMKIRRTDVVAFLEDGKLQKGTDTIVEP